MFKDPSVVHVGVSNTTRASDARRYRFLFEPELLIYYLVLMFKEKTLCNCLITGYFFNSLTIQAILNPDPDNKVEETFIGYTYRPGTRLSVYTDEDLLHNFPTCIFEPSSSDLEVNCPLCIKNKQYPLWELSRANL